MARASGSKNKSTVAKELVEALAFVSNAANKGLHEWVDYVVLHGNYAIAGNGMVTAGYPIAEDITACPHLAKLKTAISKCSKSLNITQLDNGKLSVKGEKLVAQVDCLSLDAYPFVQPDQNIASIDDRIKVAFSICGEVISEDGTRMVESALLLEANQCTACDGKTLLQYWHGIDLPPDLVLPKAFVALICKIKLPLVGFGYTPGRSVTFHFENGAWVKTILYEDKFPDVGQFINVQTNPQPIPPDLFEGVKTLRDFAEGDSVILKEGKVTTHDSEVTGAQFTVEGLNVHRSFDAEYLGRMASFATTADFTTMDDRAFFYGENTRGLVMGKKLNKEPVGESPREPEQQYRDASPSRHDISPHQIDDDIPF